MVLLSKKNVLLASFLAALFFSALFFVQKTCDYAARGFCWEYRQLNGEILESTFVLIPLFFFSLITFKLREDVFYSWVKFAAWAVPFSIILPLLTSDVSHGFMNFGAPREVLQYSLPWIFALISSAIVFGAFMMNRRTVIKK